MPAPFDTISPVTTALADNTLGPTAAYMFRRFWKKESMPVNMVDPRPIDFWSGNLFHGRINKKGAVIYPSETNLKQIPTNDKRTYWALDFVVDAFSDLQTHFQKAVMRELILPEPRSSITQLLPKRAWAGVHTDYNSYMEMIYDHLVTFWFQKEQRNSKIKNFSEFLHEFMELVEAEGRALPFTKSAFILSKYSSPLSSGLIIEIATDDHSQDIIKERRWIKDPNFPFYRNAAMHFGFLIDKNAPWRLVADVNSTIMAKYMEPYGVTSADLFETYYYQSHLFDIENLKRYLLEMYNAYVIAFPQAKMFKTKLKGGGIKTVSKLINRRPTELHDVNKQFNPAFWLKTYYHIRLREVGAERDPVMFNKELKKIIQQYKLLDFDRALSYIDNNIRRLKVR